MNRPGVMEVQVCRIARADGALGSGGLPQLVIGHWRAGARELAVRPTRDPSETSGPVFGTDLTERLDASEQVYLAPEAFSVEDPDGVAMDVFSLGALAFLLLAGQPPSPT